MSGYVAHPCFAAVLIRLLLMPTLPRKPVNRGGSRVRKVALSPSFTHLQCFMHCRNISAQLGSFPFHPSTVTLKRVHPITSTPQLQSEAWRVTSPGVTRRPETELSLYRPGLGPVSSLQGICHIHSTQWNLLRGVLKPSAKHREARVCSWSLWRLLQPKKNAATEHWGLLKLCLRGKRKGHQPVSETGFNIDVSIKELLAACHEVSCLDNV